MKTPHKHAELIKAWADGAEIEHFDILSQMWMVALRPGWHDGTVYRIKSEPKPDFVEEMSIYRNLNRRFEERWAAHEKFDAGYLADVRITFDGETSKLKSIELCK